MACIGQNLRAVYYLENDKTIKKDRYNIKRKYMASLFISGAINYDDIIEIDDDIIIGKAR